VANISVREKNYSNVDSVELEDRVSEDLAFREYIPTVYCVLRSVETGEVVETQGLFKVEGDEKTFPVTFSGCLPHGKYVLTTWGGLNSLTPLGDDHTSISFHTEGIEGYDVFMSTDTLVYDPDNSDYDVKLERTKGKLIIMVDDLPDSVNYSKKSIDGLFEDLSCEFYYSDTTSVHTQASWTPRTQIVTKTVLTPSVEENGSLLSAQLYDSEERKTPTYVLPDVNITMRRNALTAVKYVYNGNGGFETYVLQVGGEWEAVQGLIVGEE
jgi:hypothetical protein